MADHRSLSGRRRTFTESKRTVLALRAVLLLSPLSQAAVVEIIEALADREGLAITLPASSRPWRESGAGEPDTSQ